MGAIITLLAFMFGLTMLLTAIGWWAVRRRDAARPAPPAPTSQRVAPSARAGWYPHPSMADTQRYWDGRGWTDHVAPGLPGANADQKQDGGTLFIVGMIAAFLLPIVGFVLGCRLAFKRPLHGLVVIVVSVIVTVAGAALLQPYWDDWTGPSALDRADVEQQIETWAEQQIPGVVRIQCPDSMPVKKGATYECTATATTDDSTASVVVTVVSEAGGYSWNWR